MAEFRKCHENCKESLGSCLISASHWTKRGLSPREVAEDYFQVSKKFSDETHRILPENEWTKKKLDENSQKSFFTAFGLNSMPKSPIFVFIHGGLWQIEEVKAEIHEFAAIPLKKIGVASVFVEYDLAPKFTIEQMVDQISNLLEVLDELGRPIILSGHSAGAHLAAMGLMKSKKMQNISQLHLISGLYDLKVLEGTKDAEALRLNEEIIKNFSPINHVQCLPNLNRKVTVVENYKNLKIFLIVGSEESPLYRSQSQKFYENLRNFQNFEAEFAEVPGKDHFTILYSLFDDPKHPIIEFLKKSIQFNS